MNMIFALLLISDHVNASPPLDKTDLRYIQNKTVLVACLDQQPSLRSDIGCVDAVEFINAICKIRRDSPFKLVSKKQTALQNESCDLAVRAQTRWTSFFELDGKACKPGFGSLPERLVSLKKYQDSFEDDRYYMYEKNSCKEFRSYVNLCVYIDGQLGDSLPEHYDKMPPLVFGQNEKELCKPEAADVEGFSAIHNDLARLTTSPQNKIYETVILKYRARKPAGQQLKSASCEKIRTAYSNFGCEKYEKFNEGEPIYLTEKEMHDNRIKRNSESSVGGRN